MMKLEVGKTYVNGNNLKVQIVHKSQIPHRLTPFLGIVSILNGELAVYYGESGSQAGAEKFDLVKEYVEPDYRWFFMYKDGASAYSTIPITSGTYPPKGYIGRYKIDLNTGDIQKVEE